MRSSLNNANQASLLGGLYCDADRVSALIAPVEKAMVRKRCSGDHINIVDCHCDDIGVFVADVGGLDLNSKALSGGSPFIADDITIVPRDWFDRSPDTIESNVVGIRIGDILSKQPRRKWGTLILNDDVHIDLAVLSRPVFRGKRVILFASGEDVVIEGLWWRRHAISLFEAIAAGGFYAVTGMNFSLFLYECPLAHLINLNKSLAFCDELSKLGVSVVPHVYAVNDYQRTKWVELLDQRPNIQTVTINTQLQRDRHSMREVESTVTELVTKTGVNVVLNGRKPHTDAWTSAWSGRVFMANQQGLKKRAIIEKAMLSALAY
ncbi:MAG: hypothetical protein AAB834_04970 [Patescibacteria group bacterium]